MSTALPIDAIKSQFLQAWQHLGGAIVSAPPGSGKTTQLPLWLLEQTNQPIYLLIPKRMAVKLAAQQLAHNAEQTLGNRIGYRLRNDSKVSKKTQLTVTTYGSFLQLMLHQPELIEGATIILDEFHERGVDQDVCYALVNQFFEVFDDQIKRVVMSATLNIAQVQTQTQLPLIESDGFSFPVDVQYRKVDTQNSQQVAQIITEIAATTSHHVLVFCAGLKEIRQLERQLSGQQALLILHGQLSNMPDIQQLQNGDARVILATNIAESSVTLANVHTVIDLGLERYADVNPVTGITELKTRRISQASAKQRAGRAGRLGPGRAIRLWSEDEQASLVNHQPAEMTFADLTDTLLQCAVWGSERTDLPWLETPSLSRWQLAQQKLQQWQALDEHNQITEHGRAMHAMGLSPWLGHLLVIAHQHDQLASAALLAACISQNNFDAYSADTSVITNRLPSALRAEMTSILKRQSLELPATIEPLEDRLLALALADKMIFWKDAKHGTMVNGTAVICHQPSASDWSVLLNGIRQGGKILATFTVAINQQVAFEALPPIEKISFNAQTKSFKSMTYVGNIKISEQAVRPTDEQKAQAWGAFIQTNGDACFNLTSELHQQKQRWLFAAAIEPSWPEWPSKQQWAEHALMFMAGIKTFSQLPIAAIWQHALGQQLGQLNTQFPTHWICLTGRAVPLNYDHANLKVTAELKLQETFGLLSSPKLPSGLTIELHLLAPNGRAVAQVTDLSYFWAKVYPDVRKELRGRYAKHPWPENPTTFQATAQTNRQLRNH